MLSLLSFVRTTSPFSLLYAKRSFQQLQRCSPSPIIHQRPSSHSARHSVRLHQSVGSQTRCLKVLSFPEEDIPLSPSQKETIYALSTPPGRAGIAVIRISGPMVPQVYHKVVKPTSQSSKTSPNHLQRTNEPALPRTRMPVPWKMHRCSVVHPETRRVLDEGLAVYFARTSPFNWEP